MPAFRPIRTRICAALLFAAATAHSGEGDGAVRVLPDALLSWAASDFAAHGPKPEQFRNVHLRYATKDIGDRSVMLCGQVHSSAGLAKATWTPLLTIKTNPYEQSIAGVAEAFSERAKPVSADADELPATLLARVNRSGGPRPPR